MVRWTFVLGFVSWAAVAQEAPLPEPTPPPPPPPVEPLPFPPPPANEPVRGEEDVPQEVPWRAARRGFHWSLGGGGMIDPSGTGSTPSVVGYVALEPAASWGFGWVDIHVGAQALGYFSSSTKALFVALDPQVRINFASWYSLGVGPYLGLSMSPTVDFALGASLSPAVFRFGERGQHELAMWGAIPFMFSPQSSNVTLLLVTYSYVF